MEKGEGNLKTWEKGFRKRTLRKYGKGKPKPEKQSISSYWKKRSPFSYSCCQFHRHARIQYCTPVPGVPVNRLGGNAFVYGLVSSMYPAFQLIGAPILGRWSDIYGRKKILILSQIGTLISWIVFLGALYLPVVSLFKVDSQSPGSFYRYFTSCSAFFRQSSRRVERGRCTRSQCLSGRYHLGRGWGWTFGKMSISVESGFSSWSCPCRDIEHN